MFDDWLVCRLAACLAARLAGVGIVAGSGITPFVWTGAFGGVACAALGGTGGGVVLFAGFRLAVGAVTRPVLDCREDNSDSGAVPRATGRRAGGAPREVVDARDGAGGCVARGGTAPRVGTRPPGGIAPRVVESRGAVRCVCVDRGGTLPRVGSTAPFVIESLVIESLGGTAPFS